METVNLGSLTRIQPPITPGYAGLYENGETDLTVNLELYKINSNGSADIGNQWSSKGLEF